MRRESKVQALVGVMGVVVLSTMSLVAPASAHAARDLTIQRGAPTARPDSGRRAFAHERHESLPCRGCHGAGATHRATYVRSANDCASCHHDPDRALACASCHRREALPEERSVRLEVRLLAVPLPRSRDVVFQHSAHTAGDAAVPCRDCHNTPVTLARGRECASCHQSHHGGRAECSACHVSPGRKGGPHDAAVHLTCSGGGCHAAARAPLPTGARAVCIFCHDDRRQHEPDGDCAVCHRIPAARPQPPPAAAAHRGRGGP